MSLTVKQLSAMNCHYAHQSLDYFLDRAVENGLENIELWGASPHLYIGDANNERIAAVKRKIAERGLHLVCYTPETVVYPVNIAAAEGYIRRRSVDSIKRAVEITAELMEESPMMLLTAGWGYVTEPGENTLERALDSIGEIAKKAEREGVMLALEHLSPISSNIVNTAADIKRVLDTIQSPSLKAMFDTCQVNLVHETIKDYLDLLKEDLVHIHIVDGTPGGHLAFGDGFLDLEADVKLLGEYGYKGHLSMEIADRRYFARPEEADRRSIEAFKKWIQA